MPVSGAVSKPRDQIRHRNPTVDWIEVPNVPYDGPWPKLPQHRPNGQPWHRWAIRKWEAWRRMPHCILWNEVDWQFCIDAVETANKWYESRSSAALDAELRGREKIMGSTLDFRRALRIRYVDPSKPLKAAPGEAGTVSNIGDYRAL